MWRLCLGGEHGCAVNADSRAGTLPEPTGPRIGDWSGEEDGPSFLLGARRALGCDLVYINLSSEADAALGPTTLPCK